MRSALPVVVQKTLVWIGSLLWVEKVIWAADADAVRRCDGG